MQVLKHKCNEFGGLLKKEMTDSMRDFNQPQLLYNERPFGFLLVMNRGRASIQKDQGDRLTNGIS